ncbi:TraR/DksA family transcriptional regulator [Allosediminivita pacifica]|uniref:TraR/DksA family transcriptional regulator n=1 Tax=Allosediminivita pacifica TaxID=1267769 RepID=A0A2T6AVF1_9RHOB|nr:TraR/DksA C4-type zinc finger protein [Allosediminivita pacifica]PTX47787.1 TraR/DksA family transcriptional regulator [Allosediminivita pacifica]GGB12819.1 molecular chaperone DnaK [Allosediminivita pacifica]
MPDDDERTARFRDVIATRLAELDAEDALGREGQSTVALDQQAVGRLSRQDALLSQSMAKATQARRDNQRHALHAALDRLAEDEFGYCEECGEEVAARRLELDPTARRCISCASG